ncbi:unnamed protein product [Caenorhabditis nigoni]
MTMVPEEKEFVIRHVFTGPRWSRCIDGPEEMRYNIPWYLRVYEEMSFYKFALLCPLKNLPFGWSIDVDYEIKLVGKRKSFGIKGTDRFSKYDRCAFSWVKSAKVRGYIANDKLTVEWHVKIKKMEGFENLQDSGASEDKENDSAVLVVEKEKFKVDKKFLADNCTYFNTQANWISMDIDDKSVIGVLDLSARFGCNDITKKCAEFLIEKSKIPINIKFNAAIKHKNNKLKKKCLSDIKTKKNMTEIAAENADQFNASVWKELLQKSITIN